MIKLIGPIGNRLIIKMWALLFNKLESAINSFENLSKTTLWKPIISNDELRTLLASWQDLLVDYREDEEVGKGIVQNYLDPLFSKHVDFKFKLKDERLKLEMLESLVLE